MKYQPRKPVASHCSHYCVSWRCSRQDTVVLLKKNDNCDAGIRGEDANSAHWCLGKETWRRYFLVSFVTGPEGDKSRRNKRRGHHAWVVFIAASVPLGYEGWVDPGCHRSRRSSLRRTGSPQAKPTQPSSIDTRTEMYLDVYFRRFPGSAGRYSVKCGRLPERTYFTSSLIAGGSL